MKRGFTLIEVLIVVIILGILATIAVPQFSKMTKRARLAEAWTSLAAIRTAESVYYLEHDSYANDLANRDTINNTLSVDITSTNFSYSVAADGATGFNARSVGQGTGYTGIAAWMTTNGCNGYAVN